MNRSRNNLRHTGRNAFSRHLHCERAEPQSGVQHDFRHLRPGSMFGGCFNPGPMAPSAVRKPADSSISRIAVNSPGSWTAVSKSILNRGYAQHEKRDHRHSGVSFRNWP
jgi:hypothetical protein